MQTDSSPLTAISYDAIVIFGTSRFQGDVD